ncbi:ferrous iron transport protein B [Faecalispora anaeroviscerum]|uniref:ferrous iron transport protein B n=1 Tax=Faecalispora anaeroviscerum TaxID=2991836 RepID=UPI0024BB3456|nr:ferrous iron transport protein B [Faecalispora anaeroviscerum]
MSIKLALAGNPNCGKTTLFNELTGSSQYVGNWPGVTVEKKEGKLRGHKDVIVTDLPGIYSLSPYTLEEVVTRNYLIHENPDVIVNLVDASNLERNLYLTTQLVEMGLPVVLALNMMDIVRKNGDTIDSKKLGDAFGCPVVEISALKGEGTKELISVALSAAEQKPHAIAATFGNQVETALQQITQQFPAALKNAPKRWLSIKLFERDEKMLAEAKLSEADRAKLETIITKCETELDDDTESIITNERYEYIAKVIQKSYHKKLVGLTPSDKIDRIVTNRFLALPIFALVMWFVYYISISTVGTAMTDWVNDTLFGDVIPPAIESFLVSLETADWLISLIVDGILAGVGAVLGFLPQMLTMFFFLAILEDCGYMARIAFIMDRIFRRFGLSGKSFIPILIGTGCGVPGIMASRTIENDHDRRLTIITTTFIPCSAKLPIIALIAGAMFPDSSWVGPSAYFLGIFGIISSGIILKKTHVFSGDPAPFVMELPSYHVPGAKGVLIHMWDRGKSFIKKAATIILLATVLVWFLSTFSWSMQMVDIEDSMLATLGNAIAPLFAPLGFDNWKFAVATITGLIAKENVVGTFGILFGFAEVAEDGAEVWGNLQAAVSPLAAYAFLAFNLLCAPCFAAMGAARTELGSAKWTLFSVGYQTLFAYVIALIIYQTGSLLSGGGFGFWTAVAFVLIAALIYLLVRKPADTNSEGKRLNRKVSA